MVKRKTTTTTTKVNNKNNNKGNTNIKNNSNNKSKSDDKQSEESFNFPSSLFMDANKSYPFERLELEEIHPNTIWIVRSFMLQKECQAWIDFAEESSSSSSASSLSYMCQKGTRYMAARECFRMQQSNAINIATILYNRMVSTEIVSQLEPRLPFATTTTTTNNKNNVLGCNPNIRFYKYEKGHSFGKHVDGSNVVPGIGNTEITVLIYLSTCQGGATRFYPTTTTTTSRKKNQDKSIAFEPEIGTMLLHVHGDRCLEHEADPVLRGVKYVLRTDLVF